MSKPEPHNPLSGTRYRAIRSLGAGSMGEVFLVEHVDTGRRLVAKILHARFAQADEYVGRLKREARTLGQIRHPNIVAITDFETTEGGRPFIVMEYLDGHTLADELKLRRSLLPSEALAYARQVLSALAEAHAKGIVHRDVKPPNLFLHSAGGSPPVIKVLDFGAARDTQAFASAPETLKTSTGTVIGTLGYLSPEAADGQRVDLRGDLYAVGLVLTVMLSGHLPLLRSVRHELDVQAALDLPAEVRDKLGPVIMRSLADDPNHRFQSAAEFLAALPGA
jgi:serine/threonine-protein kinase